MGKRFNVNKQTVNDSHDRDKFDEREFQARVIIWLASQEMEGRNGNKGLQPTLSLSLQPQALLMHASHGFSIKRSLQNFLHKRNKRIQGHVSIGRPHDNNSTT
ncbi:uncharacterized protein LOC127095684 [Lathyrus oleraceus]|uniref:Uncharacterized protein n=1 Tax=Pisum sativum TaxID=3888 RepID=A0A9D4VZR6_PEA|nr:uncharacterized protein LOC127095684 [Pisum sativum]KAI5393105.1 hypothetical protein KIW84_060299 [Pisum sativum]